MISASQWVPRGAASENPTQMELDDSEMQRIQELAQLELEDAEHDLADAQAVPPAMIGDASSDEDDELKEFDMATYDDERPQDTAIGGVDALADLGDEDAVDGAGAGEDEYLTLPTEQDVEEERDEMRVLASENMLLAAKTEDDVSVLEVYVYDNTDEGSLWVHHDVMLPSFPLCLEWVGCRPEPELRGGNFVAVGTFEPEIEVWDLDVVDGVFPTAILGGLHSASGAEKRGTGKKKRRQNKPSADYHVDAVLSLASNPNHVNLLASGSADTTIKLWDLSKPETAVASLAGYHKNKVSAVSWHPTDSGVLLSGGYDSQVRVGDLRSADVARDSRGWTVPGGGDVENVAWGRDGLAVYAGTDQGAIVKYDARGASDKPVWTLQAHDSEITAFGINQFVDDFMVTASVDKQVKLWNLSGDRPSMLLSRDMGVGKVFSAAFGPEHETRGLVALAGSENRLKVWDTFSNRTVREAKAKGEQVSNKSERITQPDEDDESDEE